MLHHNPDTPAVLETVFHYGKMGNITQVTGANRNVSEYFYVRLNPLQLVEQHSEMVTTCAYECHGNLSSVLDANGNTNEYQYSDMGRLAKTVSLDTNTAT